MFQLTKNIDQSFRAIRLVMCLVIAGSFILCGCILYAHYRLAQKAQDRVYVLHNGHAVEVFASTRSEHLVVEAKDHIARFHELFFRLDPDESAIQENCRKALYLADASAKRQYDDLVETGYIAGIISGNISQSIRIDSIQLQTTAEPYLFRCYATLQIIRSTSIVTRNLITQGRLRSVARSIHNPHGFMIEKWETLENKDLNIENR